MLCQNCGKNEVNFRYTQVINGVKKEMALCDKCARELGLESIDFNMPINFSSFFSDFFHDAEDFLPSFAKTDLLECDKCGMTFDDFANTGEFGCGNCYITFENRISPVLKNLHGSSRHIGREYREAIDELEYNKNKFESNQKQKRVKVENKEGTNLDKEIGSQSDEGKSQKEIKLEKLQKDLQEAIKDERYEDAAKIRDEIKKIK